MRQSKCLSLLWSPGVHRRAGPAHRRLPRRHARRRQPAGKEGTGGF